MDISNLTLGEVATVEAHAGLPIAALGDDNQPKGKLLAALAFVIKKREDPKYTMFQAEQLTMDDIAELLGMEDAELGK